MVKRKHKNPAISHTWEEGKYLDLWSVVHMLSGMVLAVIFTLFNFGFITSFVIAMMLLIAWEIFEDIIKIGEVFENRVMDVVVGAVGFIPAFFMVPSDFTERFLFLLVLVIILAALGLQGWFAFSDRVKLKK